MKKISPSEALAKIQTFINRIERLEKNQYSNKRFRTADLNKLRFEFGRMYLLYSIFVFHKDKEVVKSITPLYREKFIVADNLMQNLL